MRKRTGEKLGWIGGWVGAFLWVLVLSVVWLLRGQPLPAALGLLLVALAAVLVSALAPWRHPSTPYWKLLLPAYVPLVLSVVWAVWSFRGADRMGLSPWSALVLLPLLLPFGTAGRRRWSDAGADGASPPADTRANGGDSIAAEARRGPGR